MYTIYNHNNLFKTLLNLQSDDEAQSIL